MNNMLRRIFLLLLVGIFLIPRVIFAAWWNPSTWKSFNKPSPTKTEKSIAVPAKSVNIPVQTVKKEPQKLNQSARITKPKTSNTSKKTVGKVKSGQVIKPKPISKTQSSSSQVSKNTTTSSSKKSSVRLTNEEIITKIKPAIVYIETIYGSGSGMITESNGLILTNAHVVNNVDEATVKLSGGGSFIAKVIGRDEYADLALLQVSAQGLSNVSLVNSDSVKQGDEVFTFGYPFGIEGDVSFKEGTISRRFVHNNKTYLETSTEIHPGNSGGPLVNKYGEVIGINTAMLGQSVKGITLGETIKLAIPSNVAISLIPSLKNGIYNVLPKLPELSKDVEIDAPVPRPCLGDLSDLQRVGTGNYILYGSFDFDIFPGSNEMKLIGILKNNSSCIAYNIKLKVIITDQTNPSLTQEEVVVLEKNTRISDTLFINPQSNGEYKAKITVFSALITDYIIRKELKEGVQAQTQLVSADWLPVN